jgi:hypothetical protein
MDPHGLGVADGVGCMAGKTPTCVLVLRSGEIAPLKRRMFRPSKAYEFKMK